MFGWRVIPRIGIGDFGVSPHGIGIALGYLAGTMLLARRARARGFNEDHAWNAATFSVLGAIVGARIAYVIGHLPEFQSPLEWLQIYKGGISLFGGLIGGFAFAYIYCRLKKIDFVRLTDLGAPGIALGIALGRIGDLLIGDHLGKPTTGWWGWRYRGGELISPPPCSYPPGNACIQPGMVVHQTALYDSLLSLAILLILLGLERKGRRRGFLTLSWAALYSVSRIATDFTRLDESRFGTGLTGSQITAMAVLAVSLIGLWKLKRAPSRPAATGSAVSSPPHGTSNAGTAQAAVTPEEAPGSSALQLEEEPAGSAEEGASQAPAHSREPEPADVAATQEVPVKSPPTQELEVNPPLKSSGGAPSGRPGGAQEEP